MESLWRKFPFGDDVFFHLYLPMTSFARLRTVQKYSKDFNIVTVRRNGLTLEEQALAIDIITEEDPIGRWGCRTVQEKLALQGIHIRR